MRRATHDLSRGRVAGSAWPVGISGGGPIRHGRTSRTRRISTKGSRSTGIRRRNEPILAALRIVEPFIPLTDVRASR